MKERYQNVRLGFTVVELLVVIVVIAVLASITVVAYRSVQKNAAESTVKADLSNAAKKLVIAKAKTGCPADATSLPKSDQTTYSNFSCSGQNFCIQAKSNKQATVSDYYINQDGKVTQGACPSVGGGTDPWGVNPAETVYGPDEFMYRYCAGRNGAGGNYTIYGVQPETIYPSFRITAYNGGTIRIFETVPNDVTGSVGDFSWEESDEFSHLAVQYRRPNGSLTWPGENGVNQEFADYRDSPTSWCNDPT